MGSTCSRVEAHPIIRASTVVYQDWLVNVPLFTHRHVTVAIIPPGLGVRCPSIASSSVDVDNPLRSKFRVSETYFGIGSLAIHAPCAVAYAPLVFPSITHFPFASPKIQEKVHPMPWNWIGVFTSVGAHPDGSVSRAVV